MKMHLWELKRGWTFVFDDEPETELIFLGMDGFYAKVKALDPVKHKEMCARYDAGADFFCIMNEGTVTPKLPAVLSDLERQAERMPDNEWEGFKSTDNEIREHNEREM